MHAVPSPPPKCDKGAPAFMRGEDFKHTTP